MLFHYLTRAWIALTFVIVSFLVTSSEAYEDDQQQVLSYGEDTRSHHLDLPGDANYLLIAFGYNQIPLQPDDTTSPCLSASPRNLIDTVKLNTSCCPVANTARHAAVETCRELCNAQVPKCLSFSVTEAHAKGNDPSTGTIECTMWRDQYNPDNYCADRDRVIDNLVVFDEGCMYRPGYPLQHCMFEKYNTYTFVLNFKRDNKINPNDTTTDWINQMAVLYFNASSLSCRWLEGCSFGFVPDPPAPTDDRSTDKLNAWLMLNSYRGFTLYLTGIARALSRNQADYTQPAGSGNNRLTKIVQDFRKNAPRDYGLEEKQKFAAFTSVVSMFLPVLGAIPVPGASQLAMGGKLAIGLLNFFSDDLLTYNSNLTNADLGDMEQLFSQSYSTWENTLDTTWNRFRKDPDFALSIVDNGGYLNPDMMSDNDPYNHPFQWDNIWTHFLDALVIRTVFKYQALYFHNDDQDCHGEAVRGQYTGGTCDVTGKYLYPVVYRWEVAMEHTYVRGIRDYPPWVLLDQNYNISGAQVMKAAWAYQTDQLNKKYMDNFPNVTQAYPSMNFTDGLTNGGDPTTILNDPKFWAIPICDINAFQRRCNDEQGRCQCHRPCSGGGCSDGAWDGYSDLLHDLMNADNLPFDDWCARRLGVKGVCNDDTKINCYSQGTHDCWSCKDTANCA